MKNDKHLSLYLLADGTHAKPADCEADADGVLRHIYGMPVSLREDGEPMTVGQGAYDNMNVEAAKFVDAPAEVAEPADPVAPAPQEERAAEPVAEPVAEPAEPAAAPEEEPIPAKDIEAGPAKKYKTREIKGR